MLTLIISSWTCAWAQWTLLINIVILNGCFGSPAGPSLQTAHAEQEAADKQMAEKLQAQASARSDLKV